MLECSCGLAIPSLVCLLKGAAEITLSDQQCSLSLIQEKIEEIFLLNGQLDRKKLRGFLPLEWGSTVDSNFDLVLLSDCFYERNGCIWLI